MISDDQLSEAQQRFDRNALGVWDLVALERAHLAAQEPLGTEAEPKRATVVIDREGDAWRFGNTRWTCITPVDGTRTTSVARLGHKVLVDHYGPIRIIGHTPTWRYRTIRGRT